MSKNIDRTREQALILADQLEQRGLIKKEHVYTVLDLATDLFRPLEAEVAQAIKGPSVAEYGESKSQDKRLRAQGRMNVAKLTKEQLMYKLSGMDRHDYDAIMEMFDSLRKELDQTRRHLEEYQIAATKFAADKLTRGKYTDLAVANDRVWRLENQIIELKTALEVDLAQARIEAGAAMCKLLSRHYPMMEPEDDGDVCGCGEHFKSEKDWIEHILALAPTDALAEVVRKAKLEEAEDWNHMRIAYAWAMKELEKWAEVRLAALRADEGRAEAAGKEEG